MAQLIPDGVKPGTIFTVEFDPDSQWLAVATTITAKYLQAGGRAAYVAAARSPEAAREALTNLGIDVPASFRKGVLTIDDGYTATLTGGRIDTEPGKSMVEPIQGGLRFRTLKVADLSVQWLKASKQGWAAHDVAESWPPGALGIFESNSELLRFNDENAFAEFYLSRVVPNERRAKRVSLNGIVRGIHSESLYRRVQNATDGVIEVVVREQNDEAQDFIRVKSLKGQPRDARWHRVQVKTHGEAVLVA